MYAQSMEVNKVVGQWKQPVFIHCLLRLGVGSMQENITLSLDFKLFYHKWIRSGQQML
jgi:hypothetical protein